MSAPDPPVELREGDEIPVPLGWGAALVVEVRDDGGVRLDADGLRVGVDAAQLRAWGYRVARGRERA